MRTIVEFITAVALIAWVGSAMGAELSTNTSGRNTPPGSFEYAGALAFQEDLPVDRVVGTSEFPKLLVIKSIRFESTFGGRSWRVIASLGWLPVKEMTWKIKVELIDGENDVLKHFGDRESVFTTKSVDVNEASMRHAALELSEMTCQGRRHATRFRIHLGLLEEPSGGIDVVGGETDPIEITVLDQKSQKPIVDAVVIVSNVYFQDTNLPYQTIQVTNAQGRCQARLSHRLQKLSINAQRQGFSPITLERHAGPAEPIANLPERHVFEMRRGMSVGGIVQDTEGRGIDSAEVKLIATKEYSPSSRIVYVVRGCVRTDSEGRWEVEGIPFGVERITLGVKHPDYGGENGWSKRISGKALLNAQALKHRNVLAKGLTLAGNVYNDQGRPVERATVMLKQQSYDRIYTITDASGGFRLMCSKDEAAYRGESAVIVEAPGYAPALQPFDLQQQLRPLEYRLDRGRLVTVRVVDSNGQPLGGATLRARPLPEKNLGYIVSLAESERPGIFQVPNMPKNDIRFTVRKWDYFGARDQVMAASEDEVVIPLRQLPPMREINRRRER